MRTVVLDSNAFILYIVGLVNPARISSHKRTSIFDAEDFYYLQEELSKYDKILTCPNVLTEVDDLLNDFSGSERYNYFNEIYSIINDSIEDYVKSKDILQENEKWIFENVGLADFVVLRIAKNAELLVSADSKLCDFANSMEIPLFDLKKYVNEKLRTR